MMRSLSFFVFVLFSVPRGLPLPAQPYQVNPDACFRLEADREFPLHLQQEEADTGRFTSTFFYDPAWSGKAVFARIPGLRVPYAFLINGFTLARETGSSLDAEYYISPLLREGSNTLELVPDPAMPGNTARPCGVCGSGSLRIREGIHISDLEITSIPEQEGGSILLRFRLFVKSYLEGRSRGCGITLDLADPQGERVSSRSERLEVPLAYGQETEVVIDCLLEAPLPWSPSEPRLYEARVRLWETGQDAGEVLHTRFPLRSLEVADSLVVLNGDTLLADPAASLDPSALFSLDREAIIRQTEKDSCSIFYLEGPLPCRLSALLDELGILAIPRQ